LKCVQENLAKESEEREDRKNDMVLIDNRDADYIKSKLYPYDFPYYFWLSKKAYT